MLALTVGEVVPVLLLVVVEVVEKAEVVEPLVVEGSQGWQLTGIMGVVVPLRHSCSHSDSSCLHVLSLRPHDLFLFL